MLKEVDPVDALRSYADKRGSQKAAAHALGVSSSYLSEMLRRSRGIPTRVLDALGLREAVVQKRASGATQ
jgi:antitoxin component HigA of HigAB toxin-antitoxin module